MAGQCPDLIPAPSSVYGAWCAHSSASCEEFGKDQDSQVLLCLLPPRPRGASLLVSLPPDARAPERRHHPAVTYDLLPEPNTAPEEPPLPPRSPGAGGAGLDPGPGALGAQPWPCTWTRPRGKAEEGGRGAGTEGRSWAERVLAAAPVSCLGGGPSLS